MLKITAFKNGKEVKDVSEKSLKGLLSNDGLVWVDVQRGDKKDFEFVERAFELHPLTVEDMRKSRSLPKIDVLQDRYMFVIFHELYYDKRLKKVKLNEVDFCIGRNFLITVHVPPVPSIDTMRDKMLEDPTRSKTGPDYIMYGIMDIEVDGYMNLMDQLDEEIENLEDKLIRGRGGNVLQVLSNHRREITELRKIVGPQRDIINRLSRGESQFISKHMLFYFRDVYDHMFRFYYGLEAHRDMMVSAFETYTSVQSNSINRVIKQLTIIATIFLPLTFVTGVYGMNFRVMPEIDFEYGYFLMLAAMAAVGLGMWIYFKKKKY